MVILKITIIKPFNTLPITEFTMINISEFARFHNKLGIVALNEYVNKHYYINTILYSLKQCHIILDNEMLNISDCTERWSMSKTLLI